MNDICSRICRLLLVAILLTSLLLDRDTLFAAHLFACLARFVPWVLLGFLVVAGLLRDLVRWVDGGCLTLVLCRECETRIRRILIKYYRRCSFLAEFIVILMGLYYVSFIFKEKLKMILNQVIFKFFKYLSFIFSKYLALDNF
jgi:hypothetical protein